MPMVDLTPFRNILLTADPAATKYDGNGAENYTTWTPGGISREMSDDGDDDLVQRVYVDRYTKLDNDAIVGAIWSALESAGIPFEYERDYENDTKYHHHIFTCYYSG